ncbi:MAG: hypothetical protein Q8N09_09905 [Thermodesulfovibrionia bacterium]|nr:hypothetical protein [Thermodesulfovibrionia bacterium]
MPTSILDGFKKLDKSLKEKLADINSPQKTALSVLQISYDNFKVEYLTPEAIIACLEAADISIKKIALVRALARSGNKVSTKKTDDGLKYKITIHGRRSIENILSTDSLQIIYVRAGTPRTARNQLKSFLNELKGQVKICDPYYGVRTFDVLELIPKSCNVSFLTLKTNENVGLLKRVIKDFVTEHPKTSIKQYNGKDIHDRYIITDSNFIIVGHGIKDIGNKDSFVITIEKAFAPDLWIQISNSFNNKWSNSIPL